MVPIESIRPYDNNPRRHDEISEIVESIQRVGFRGSIWVDKDMEIIAGHGRYLSALQLGMKEVPVTVMDDLTEAEVKYLRIKDNRASEQSTWDEKAYAKELDELRSMDFDTSDIEFEATAVMDEMEQVEEDTPTDIIHADKPSRNAQHPTMKPIKLMAYLLHNSSVPGDWVLDFFGGSGSTMMACEQLGRRCAMMEYDPKYADVIIERWQNLTGEDAELIEGES